MVAAPTSKAPKPGKSDELVDAIRKGDASLISVLLDLGAQVKTPDSTGVLPLVGAAEVGSVPILQTLLDAGANPNQFTSNGNTPLRAAVLNGDAESIAELLKRGADVNLETSRGTALTAAASQGDCDILSLLLESGSTIDYETKDGLTALMAAVREDRRQAVHLLLRKEAQPDFVSSATGASALSIAQEKMLPEVYSLLMQRSVTNAAEEALEACDRRMHDAKVQLDEEERSGREALTVRAAEGRAEVASKVTELQQQKAQLLARMGLPPKEKKGQTKA